MKKLLLFAATWISMSVMAQIPYGRIVDKARSASPYFKALEAHRQADEAAAYASPMIENPEVEFGFYNGHPSDIGRRWDLSASQTLEFPSVYKDRLEMRRNRAALAGVEADLEQADLVKDIQLICSEIVYQRALISILKRCQSNAEDLSENYHRRMESGDCGILEFNRAQLVLTEARNRYESALIELSALMRHLALVTQLDADELEADLASYAESSVELIHLQSALKDSYSQEQTYRAAVADGEVEEARSEMFPKVSIGYASENIIGETFRGVSLGIELPLWRSTRGIKAAKAAAIAEKEDAQIRLQMLSEERDMMYDKLMAQMNRFESLKQSFSQFGTDQELLRKALDGGQISLEEYLLQVDSYTEWEISLAEARKGLDQSYIEFRAICQ